jgi:Lrp/AsnC family transcriptional regulator for asnA, asnC and gidA
MSAESVDDMDLRLLAHLAENARLSHRSLARLVGMSPPAVTERVSRLERKGIIRGYRADLDMSMVGYPLTVYVNLITHQGPNHDHILDALADIPEVTSAEITAGRTDMLVRLLVRDHQHLRQVLYQSILAIDGIERTESLPTLGGVTDRNQPEDLLRKLLSERDTTEHIGFS